MAKCKICSNEIVGRSDKKFCSVRCKNYYHTNLRKVSNTAVGEINKILHRNRSILLEILGKKTFKKKVERIVLDKKKFNFKYHTHIQQNKEGKIYFFVYDFAWMQFSNNEILLTRQKVIYE